MGKGRDITRTEANLISYGQKQKESLKRKVEQKENYEKTQYKFHPTLLPSKALYNKYMNSDTTQVHNKLYSHANQQQKAKIAAGNKETHPFKPYLITSNPELDRPRSKDKLVSNFYKWKDELDQKIEEKRHLKLLHETIEDDKGNRLFKPFTNSTEMTRHRSKDVFKYLYSLHSSRRNHSKHNKENNEFIVGNDLTPQVKLSSLII
jgi:hypothetical protein